MSCGKDDNGNENIFKFNLNNNYRIDSTGVKFETPDAFEPQNIPEFNIILSDSEIGNELVQPCCGTPWNCPVNPSTEVKISFTK